jgi:hypothetical protein
MLPSQDNPVLLKWCPPNTTIKSIAKNILGVNLKKVKKFPLTAPKPNDRLSSDVNILKKGARFMANIISAIVIQYAWARLQVVGID